LLFRSLLLLSLIFYFVHNAIVDNLEFSYSFFYPVWTIYTFHFLVAFTILSVLYLVGRKSPNYIGYVFMGFILFKMIAAVIFLIPLIKMEGSSKIPDFISFFAPYFAYLFLEILVTLELVKRSET